MTCGLPGKFCRKITDPEPDTEPSVIYPVRT